MEGYGTRARPWLDFRGYCHAAVVYVYYVSGGWGCGNDRPSNLETSTPPLFPCNKGKKCVWRRGDCILASLFSLCDEERKNEEEGFFLGGRSFFDVKGEEDVSLATPLFAESTTCCWRESRE